MSLTVEQERRIESMNALVQAHEVQISTLNKSINSLDNDLKEINKDMKRFLIQGTELTTTVSNFKWLTGLGIVMITPIVAASVKYIIG